MAIRRRDFIGSVFAGTCLPANAFSLFSGILQDAGTAGTQQSGSESADDFLDDATIKFWKSEVRTERSRAASGLPDPGRVPEFLVHTDDDHGFRSISEIKDKELLPSGDASVSFWVNQFKPSAKDLESGRKLRAASLRLDLQQQKPMVPILGVFSWSVMAAIFSKKASSLPPISNLSLDNGAKMQNVPLPGGTGKWTWNVFVQHESSPLSRFIKFALQEAEKFSPLLSLPAITTPTLQAVDKIYSYWQAKASSKWLFNSRDIDVCATAEGRAQLDPASAVPLVRGTYILIPQSHLPQFKSIQNQLTIQRGVIVPKGTDPKEVFVAANKTLPDLTYVTVNVNVANWVMPGPQTPPKS